MSLSADCSLGPSNYEYLFMARSGARSHIDLEQLQKRREQLRHVTRSVDQYVEMKSRVPDGEERRETNVEPVAITSIYENRPIKTLNPRRKLRRHAFENYEPESSPCADKSPCSETDSFVQEPMFVSNAFLTLKSSQESLLDDKRDAIDEHSTPEGREATDKRLKRVQMMLPTSPTHYVQPPTPDHPPPSAMQAEKSIHERIRPLSQVSWTYFVDLLVGDFGWFASVGLTFKLLIWRFWSVCRLCLCTAESKRSEVFLCSLSRDEVSFVDATFLAKSLWLCWIYGK